MKSATPAASHALLRLGAHHPAPARVEIVYQSALGRFARALLAWMVCWGALPLLIWVPPHYPWVTAAFLAGIYLPYRFWTGRYRVCSFAGSCPRCGRALALGVGSKIDLPHTLTCFGCHFEPRLEIVPHDASVPADVPARIRIGHRDSDCTGGWVFCWIRDETWMVCDRCGAAHPATAEARRAADAENEAGHLLRQLSDDGRFLV